MPKYQLPQTGKNGILFDELVGIESLESKMREAVVAVRSQLVGPGQVYAWARPRP
jgi:hypothetical protein